MAKNLKYFLFIIVLKTFLEDPVHAQVPQYDRTREGYLVFHPIKTDALGHLISWASDTPARAFDSVIRATWRFWKNMRTDLNGLPYYMNHQVWRPVNDPRGIGGDQFAMALSSLGKLYDYTGDEAVRQNMIFIADYYLSHSLSHQKSAWPDIPFPYNTMIYSGCYDGDMILGQNMTQPDKAGSFGWELLKLYKITHNIQYLRHAILIANTLAVHTVPGSGITSPLPFKVNAISGKTKVLRLGDHGWYSISSTYTTNFRGTIELWLALNEMHTGNTLLYRKSLRLVVDWLKNYPLRTNKWGPFFEDIPGWSDTQMNAVSTCSLMMEHPDLFPEWRSQVRQVLNWVYDKLGNDTWQKYGVKVVNEQTAYLVPGNSHTARQAAAELEYIMTTTDTSRRQMSIRQLVWATYCVNFDGKNCYPRDEVWMTDGYGDFIRHYLNAMAFDADLAPSGENHLLSSSSVITSIAYDHQLTKEDADAHIWLKYETFDTESTEKLRLMHKPGKITGDQVPLTETDAGTAGEWQWKPLNAAGEGVLTISHLGHRKIVIYK